MEPWSRGAVEPWSRGAVEPWSRGAVEPWSRGAVEPWSRGAVEPWSRGAVRGAAPGEEVQHRDGLPPTKLQPRGRGLPTVLADAQREHMAEWTQANGCLYNKGWLYFTCSIYLFIFIYLKLVFVIIYIYIFCFG